MKVTVRKAPLVKDKDGWPISPLPPVVVELWMSSEEAILLDLHDIPLREAVEEALTEHLRSRFRVSRQVKETPK
ncbi:MAG: hypothetical protein WA154_12885 [Moraxellaceae bacterium]